MQTRTILSAIAAMLLSAGAANADVFNMGSGLTGLSFVTVGNPGNAASTSRSPANGSYMGSVGYTYQIGKYDVTAGQYCQFLNAVAATDPYGLYNTYMSAGPGGQPGRVGCGITRTGIAGNYSYNTTSSGYSVNNGDFPVNFISWGDAARFCNWLTNGQPATGVEDLSTTENGSYYLNGSTSDTALQAVNRACGAKYVIPTENEWFKAGFYDPTLNSGSGGYWQYLTKSNTSPSNVLSSTGTNNGNYKPGSTYTDPTNYLTVVGAFAGSPGPYGTYDMGGDVMQRNEMIITGSGRNDRCYRGGSYVEPAGALGVGVNFSSSPSREYDDVGFRVAQVPEPASATLMVLGGLVLLRRFSRKNGSTTTTPKPF